MNCTHHTTICPACGNKETIPNKPVCVECYWSLDRTWHHAWDFASQSTRALLANAMIEEVKERNKERMIVIREGMQQLTPAT
jgi:hypothetical protein